MKNSLPSNSHRFRYSNNKKCILYFGSQVVKCESSLKDGRIRVFALNTGYNTRRGDLVQNLLFPKSSNFDIFQEIKYILVILAVMFLTNMAYLIWLAWFLNNKNASLCELEPDDRSN